jgi:hypothetical protein
MSKATDATREAGIINPFIYPQFQCGSSVVYQYNSYIRRKETFKDAFVPKDKSEVINRRIDNTDPTRRTNNDTAQTTKD